MVANEESSISSATLSPGSSIATSQVPQQQRPAVPLQQVMSPQIVATHVHSPRLPAYPHSIQPSSMTPAPQLPQNAQTNAMFRVHMWSNTFDSGERSLNPSSVPSVMSVNSLRAGSQISTISEDSHPRIELTDQQQMKFENIPANIGRGTQDGETRNAIPELINLMRDSDEIVVQRAATMVQNIAKMDSEQPPYSEPVIRASEIIPQLNELLRIHPNSPTIIKPVLGALFQISERRDGLESIIRHNEKRNGVLLVDIIHHMKFTGGSALRYAILTFHTIIAEKSVDGKNIEIARNNGALQAITQFLDRETNEKLLSVVVECIRLLCDKNQSKRMLFIQLEGPIKLLNILTNLRYEGLLWRTTQLLKAFSNADPQAIVACGGFDVLYKQLDHASQRLIISTLECIRNMSDVPTKDLDVSVLLNKLLQLLGAMDPVVVLYCTGILSNLLANNQMNKEFLYNQGAIPTLYRVLINSYNITAAAPNHQQRIEDIQERALATLRHLCVGHTHQNEAQEIVLQTNYAAEFLLRKLTEMRPSILKQTLQILNKASLQDRNLPTLRSTRIKLSNECETTIFERILVILKVACEQLSSTQMIEEVRVVELIHLSLSTLQLMCRDPPLLQQIVLLIRRQDFLFYSENNAGIVLPIFCLYQGIVEDENLKRSALGLVSELALYPEMAASFASDISLMATFQQYSRSRNQAFATYAQQAYQRLLQASDSSAVHYHSYTTCDSAYRSNAAVQGAHSNHVPYDSTYPTEEANYFPSHHLSDTYDHHYEHYSQPDPMPALSVAPSASGARNDCFDGNVQDEPASIYDDFSCAYERASGQNYAMDYSISDEWPDNLSTLSISDDPFATIFCSQFNPSSQKLCHQTNKSYQSSHKAQEAIAGSLYCDTGVQSSEYYEDVGSIQMGSPEAPVSLHDSCNVYKSYM